MKTPAGILLSRPVLGVLLALAPLGCHAESPEERPPVVAQVGVPVPEPGAEVTALSSNAVGTAVSDATTNGMAAPAEVPALSPALEEVVRLLQAGVSPDVIEVFITNSAGPFQVGSAQLVYLQDLGAPAPVMTALIRHDAQPGMQALKQGSGAPPQAAAMVAPEAKPAAPNPAPSPAAAPAPETSAPPAPSSTAVYQVPEETRTVTYSHFYTSLAPYGAWVDVPGYGYCWRPTVAIYEPAWRPYCDAGRWLWSDRGWYWYSTYSWGWAPFHYGRWCQPAGLGWVWVPSTCWGPAWVSWRYTTAGYCGWAPLPPSAGWVAGVGFRSGGVSVGIGFDFGLASSAYVFCPVVRFCDPRPSRHCVPHHERETHYKGSTVINNYIVGNNNTVINQGFGMEKVAKVTKEGVRKVTVQDVALRGERGPRPERISDDGRVVSVHRPLWASASDRPVPARPASGEHAKAFTPAAGAGLRPIGLADSRSPAVASSTGFVRPTPTAPFTPDPGAPSAVKPVSSASVSRDRVVPPGLTGNESKPYSIRRGPAVDNASPRTTVPERTPPVVRQPAVSSSLADRPSQPPLSPVKGVTPGAPRLDAASAVSVPPSPTRGGAGSKVPVSSRSAVPSVQPSVSPSAPKTAPGPSFASPGRPVAPAVMPRNDVPRAAVPAASGPPSAGRVYASTAPVAPRVSAPGTAAPTPSRGGGGGASMPSIFSPARSQGGRSTGGADLSSAGKSGR